MDRYIEVIGEGTFTETAVRFIAEITLEVRAAKGETSLREVAELCSEALSVLRAAEINDDEIVEGGTDFRRPWYWKKKETGQNAARKIILKVTEFGKLNRALEQLEPLQSQNKERKTISIDMRQPEFKDDVAIKSNALAEAFDDAKSKASRLSVAMGYALGQPIRFEEGGWATRNSGFSGDEDWGGDYSRFAMGGGIIMGTAAAAEPEPDLLRPTRTIYIKCRVRFAING